MLREAKVRELDVQVVVRRGKQDAAEERAWAWAKAWASGHLSLAIMRRRHSLFWLEVPVDDVVRVEVVEG